MQGVARGGGAQCVGGQCALVFLNSEARVFGQCNGRGITVGVVGRHEGHEVIDIDRGHVLPIGRHLGSNHFGTRGTWLQGAQRPFNRAVGVRRFLIRGADKIERRGQLIRQHYILRVTFTRVLVAQRKRDRIARIRHGRARRFRHDQIGRFPHSGYRGCRLLWRLGGGHKRLIGQGVAHLHTGGVHGERNGVGFARIEVGELPDECRVAVSDRRGTRVGGLEGGVVGQAVGHCDTGQRHLAGVFISELVAEHLTHHNLRLRIRAGLGQADRCLSGVVRYGAHR